jgi:hypothetical protein
VDNSVHNRFLVTETLPPFSELRWSAAFLITLQNSHHRRRLPAASKHILAWPIQAQGKIEFAAGCGQPISVVTFPGRIVLNEKIQGTIAVEFQCVAISNGKSVNRIGNKISILAVQP